MSRIPSAVRLVVVTLTLAAVAACQRGDAATVDTAALRADSIRKDSIARARQDSINRTLPGYVIDSVHPVAEEIRRFKARVAGTAVSELQHASPSRDALVKRLIEDIAKGDTLDLAYAAITPREFIDLVYPSSPYTHPPSKESPAVIWMQIADASVSGYKRLLARDAGHAYQLEAYTCDPNPEHQGPNTLWTHCVVRVVTPTKEIATHRWFGTILERDGKFKLVSYKNEY